MDVKVKQNRQNPKPIKFNRIKEYFMNAIVSIITPVYNSSRFVKQCLLSTTCQSYPYIEHILVDDCSTDGSVNIIEGFAKSDSRIKLIKLTENGGAGVARNTAIKAATGRFIAFLDSDDFWHKDKLKLQVDFMLKNDYAFTYTQYYIVNEYSEVNKLVHSPSIVHYKDILRNGYIGCLTAMYDSEKIGKHYMPLIRKRQDWSLWIMILKEIKVAYGIDQPLAYYRVGNESLSNNKFKLVKFNFNVFRKVLNMGFLESSYRMVVFLFCYFKFKLFSIKNVEHEMEVNPSKKEFK